MTPRRESGPCPQEEGSGSVQCTGAERIRIKERGTPRWLRAVVTFYCLTIMSAVGLNHGRSQILDAPAQALPASAVGGGGGVGVQQCYSRDWQPQGPVSVIWTQSVGPSRACDSNRGLGFEDMGAGLARFRRSRAGSCHPTLLWCHGGQKGQGGSAARCGHSAQRAVPVIRTGTGGGNRSGLFLWVIGPVLTSE